MAHRKGEKEALRRQREEREAKARAEQRRKRLVGFGAAGALALAAVVIVFVLVGGGGNGSGPGGGSNVFPEGGEVAEQKVFDVEEAASAAGCELTSSESRGEKDRVHTQSTDQTVKYRDNPPTLGSHWPPGFEAQDGLYGKAPADESLVHTLEHGRVIFWVKPSLPKTARESLRALFDEDTYQLVMVPRQDMPYAVAATAWNRDPVPGGTGRTLGCDEWTPEAVDALRAFRDQHRSNGPEPVP
ncbi:MAG TPA: DUF3105 domain-containing protein [Thermoleophilaceae bacterium]|jgi:hypothetical protein|nr:DUF3105 domain-containing protein [Thermoleophilaceae bacterium]